jgi:LysM repeat protein
MNRRDIVVVAVLINIGLLALLFATAINHDENGMPVQTSSNSIVENSVKQEAFVDASPEPTPVNFVADEVDQALQSHAAEMVPIAIPIEPVEPTPVAAAEAFKEKNDNEGNRQEKAEQEMNDQLTGQILEVTVKKGDSLDKLARVHKSSVEGIRKASQLKSDRLDIGQVLKVPVGEKSNKIASGSVAEEKQESNSQTSQRQDSSEVEYYVIKKGDNPWKLAKKFNVDFEDLLKLNNLNEEKARNLKIGDKIRVK